MDVSIHDSARFDDTTPLPDGEAGLHPAEGLRVGTIRRRARQTLFHEGDPAGVFYAIAEGTVMLYKVLPDGRRQISRFLFAGSLFGLSDQDRHRYTAETLTPVVLTALDPQRIAQTPTALPWLSRHLLGEAEALRDHSLLLGCSSAPERMAAFLVGLIPYGETSAGRGVVLPVFMSRQEIGDHLSLAIETVCRQITRLKKEGLIALEGNDAIRLPDPARLLRLAGAA